MAANINPVFPATIKSYGTSFQIADTTDLKPVFYAGLNGARVDSISAVSTDTVNQLFSIFVGDGLTNYQVGEIAIIAGCGTDGTTKAMSLMTATYFPWLDVSGSIYLEAGWELGFKVKSGAVTNNKEITIVANGGDY